MKLYQYLSIGVVLIASGVIVSTYATFTHTIDEPIHIACGLEWLQDHRYTFEVHHPPLARIAAALGPWLTGAKNVPKEELLRLSPNILYESPSYERTLTLARLGELPFFLGMCWAVWAWTNVLRTGRAAFLSVLLLASTPVVLGHAGLATTDISVTALLVLSTYLYSRWLSAPLSPATAKLSAAVALGACSKFTFLVFFPLCVVAVTILSEERWDLGLVRARARSAVAGGVLVVGIVWLLYWLRVDSVPTHEGPVGLMRHLPDFIRESIQQSHTISLPLGGFYRGLVEAQAHEFNGHRSYLFGEIRSDGWWYFFPVVFFLKTPVTLMAATVAAWTTIHGDSRRTLIPLGCAVAILCSVLPARINLGIRHILPIFPFLAVACGCTLDRLLSTHSRWIRLFAVTLTAMHVAICAATYPDYIAYFNLFAGSAPEQIRVDSDLDWGQDIARLAAWQRRYAPNEKIALAYFATGSPTAHGVDWERLSPWEPPAGQRWVAVSATELKMSEAERPAGESRQPWWWLRRRKPASRIGGILLYRTGAGGPRGCPVHSRTISDYDQLG